MAALQYSTCRSDRQEPFTIEEDEELKQMARTRRINRKFKAAGLPLMVDQTSREWEMKWNRCPGVANRRISELNTGGDLYR